MLESAPVPESSSYCRHSPRRGGTNPAPYLNGACYNSAPTAENGHLSADSGSHGPGPRRAAAQRPWPGKPGRSTEQAGRGTGERLRDLMSYPEASAGRLMQPRAPSIPARLTVKQALNRLRRFPPRDTAVLLITDDSGKLLGLMDLVDIVHADPDTPLETLVHITTPFRVNALTPREEIIDLFTRYRLRLLPVVDIEDRLLGVIRQSTVIKATQEEAATDMQAMVGVSRDERALSSPLSAMRKRLPWLNINLLTAFLAAAVVGLFENTIAQFTALAVLLPVVAGQSGNTGAQALAVIMRGLALREIQVRHWQRVLLKEVFAGALNGIAIAIVTGLALCSGASHPASP